MVAGKTTNGMASSTVSKDRCERVAMASAGVGMCGELRTAGAHLCFGAGSKFRTKLQGRAELASLVVVGVGAPR